MRVHTSPWEAAEAGIGTVTIAQAVLDQILHGNLQVYSEIQALQDQGVTVQLLDRERSGSRDAAPDLVVLRHTLSDRLELEHTTGTAGRSPTKAAALWYIAGTGDEDLVAAEAADCDRYEPQIVLVPFAGPLSQKDAERCARRIGAL